MAQTLTTPTLAAQVGEVLRAARGDRSQRQVARDLGVAGSTLNEIEMGRDNPTLERLERLALGYGVRIRITAEPLDSRRPRK